MELNRARSLLPLSPSPGDARRFAAYGCLGSDVLLHGILLAADGEPGYWIRLAVPMLVTVRRDVGTITMLLARRGPVQSGRYLPPPPPFGQAWCCPSGRKAVAVGRNRHARVPHRRAAA
jgi:hypothetical protein